MRAAVAAALIWACSLAYVWAGVDLPGVGVGRVELPRLLSDTGINDARTRAFSPQYPLWSDGARKTRWVLLPEGMPIDAHNVDAWEFPDGTRFWKQFEFSGRKVETRMLSKVGGEWRFASYIWNDAQTDAVLAPAAGAPAVFEIAPGKTYSIPSVEDCRACHVTNRPEVLGFTALQLSTDRDPLAPHAEPVEPGMVTLRTLVDDDLLQPRRPELVSRPPRIAADDGRTRAVLGMLSANCGNCHNADSSIANLGLLLRQPAYATREEVAASVERLLQRTRKWQTPGSTPETSVFVAPGAPERSGLLLRMRSRRPATQMPPLGTVVPDHQAIDLVTSWAQAMRSSSPGSVPPLDAAAARVAAR